MGTDIHGIIQVKSSDGWYTVALEPCRDRDYDSFAVLADVRNGFGVAGRESGERWKPISVPRGIPEDLDESMESDFAKIRGRDVWLGDHSYSWVLLSEIQNAIEELVGTEHKIRGVITREQYDAWKTQRKVPETWCLDTFGGSTIVVDEKDLSVPGLLGIATHVRAWWSVPATERLLLLHKLREQLESVARANEKPAVHVRFVFGFDS